MPHKIKSIDQLNHEINIAPMIERLVSGELMKIEHKVQTDLDNGLTESVCSLTYNYNIPNMALGDAQTMIYAEVIRRMEDDGKYRGLEIEMESSGTTLFVPLRTIYQRYQQDEAKNILRQHRRKRPSNNQSNNNQSQSTSHQTPHPDSAKYFTSGHVSGSGIRHT
jgi:hypothetical protein